MSLRLVRIDPSPAVWRGIEANPATTVFQTAAWSRFLEQTQGLRPVVAQVDTAGTRVGWFVGGMVRVGPLRVLGSPLRGWTTSYMGFSLDTDAPCSELAAALDRFAFQELDCHHLEWMDRRCEGWIPPPPHRHLGFQGYRRALQSDDDALLDGMTPHGRRDVRRAVRNGVPVEEVRPDDVDRFVAEYYRQVTDAFARRGRRAP